MQMVAGLLPYPDGGRVMSYDIETVGLEGPEMFIPDKKDSAGVYISRTFNLGKPDAWGRLTADEAAQRIYAAFKVPEHIVNVKTFGCSSCGAEDQTEICEFCGTADNLCESCGAPNEGGECEYCGE